MVEQGTFDPMTDVEIVTEIRQLLTNLDEMPTHFRCGDFSLNLLMDVDGRLDRGKDAMLRRVDDFLRLDADQQKAFSLLRRSRPGYRSLNAVEDAELMEKLNAEVRRLEQQEPDGFNRAIRLLMARQLPQPPNGCWPTIA
jgi:hypothetical protein